MASLSAIAETARASGVSFAVWSSEYDWLGIDVPFSRVLSIADVNA
jgi:hypothetical protein